MNIVTLQNDQFVPVVNREVNFFVSKEILWPGNIVTLQSEETREVIRLRGFVEQSDPLYDAIITHRKPVKSVAEIEDVAVYGVVLMLDIPDAIHSMIKLWESRCQLEKEKNDNLRLIIKRMQSARRQAVA